MRIAIDLEGRHALVCTPVSRRRARLTLVHDRGDRVSPLHRALEQVVKVRAGAGAARRVAPGTSVVEVDHAGQLTIMLGDDEVVVATVRLTDAAEDVAIHYQLSAFECRYLAEYGRLHTVPSGAVPRAEVRTDLHSHFAGCVAASTLVELAAERGVTYPPALLEAAGIRLQGSRPLPVAELSPPIRRALAAKLEVPTQRRITFLDMERIYRLRSPLTKHADMFVPLLRQIAEDYAAMGVEYAELSFGDIPRASRLRAVHEHLPAIEADTGVTLRFLAAMSRHDDVEWDLDYIDRLGQLAGSRYIVGVDFMGHETNSTHAFATQLRAVARWADRVRPGFVVRVHAGENPAHPENVRVALDCVQGCQVALRIGHGLYGVDDAALDRLTAAGAVVEFNLNSNFALNNIQRVGQAPLVRYLRRGVPVVLGSDGYGIYRTTPALEVRAAWLCGVGMRELAQIVEVERAYVARVRAREEDLPGAAFVVPDDSPSVHFSDAVTERKRDERRRRDERLTRRVREVDTQLLSRDGLGPVVAGKRCISFAGAWRHSWQRMEPAEQSHIRLEIERLIDGLDPARHVLISGGTRYGVEGVVAARARQRGIRHVGVLVASTPPESLQAGAMTHAIIVGDSLHDKAAALYTLMRDAGGLCLFIGGGNIVSDEIQCARNLRVRYLLMAEVSGASGLHAREQPVRAFRRADEVLEVLALAQRTQPGPAYRYVGVNPTVDVLASRRNPDSRALELLLVRRDLDSQTESGAWALPGGFVATTASVGTAWRADAETERAAAVRELYEETGLDVRDMAPSLTPIGCYERGGRDPRDSERAWSRTMAFALAVPPDRAALPVAGGDDACDARWFPVSALPLRLAFDHRAIVADWTEWCGRSEIRRA